MSIQVVSYSVDLFKFKLVQSWLLFLRIDIWTGMNAYQARACRF